MIPAPGDVLHVPERDYLYGQGTLHLRVARIGEVVRLDDGDWLELEGQQLRSTGAPLQRDPRLAWVRVQALIGRTERRRAATQR